MESFWSWFYRARDLAPHGYCLLWDPWLIWTHVVADALIALAYFSIPVAIVRFVRARDDVQFSGIFWLFAIFILACGCTHLMAIWTLWNPDYQVEAVIKLITAIASVGTAIVLWPLIPKALAIPSPLQLSNANAALTERVRERDAALAQAQREVEQRQAAEAALVQSQKMEAVGQLTGGIAHDFNNMLSIVMGSLDMAGRRIAQGKAEDAADFITNAQEGAKRASELTARLMAFSRQQPLQPQPIDTNALVKEMSQLLRRTIGEQIKLETVLAGGLWQTFADPHQLESALVNLCVNARDAMQEGGKLTIETANGHLDDAYAGAHPGVEPGQYVMICVTDTGSGMSPQTIERAFDPFFTTKDVGQGTGLGLSQVFGFIKQSRGHVKIYSEPGHGTTVRIYLPRSRGDEAAIELNRSEPARDAGALPRAKAGETILVVEDEALVRQMAVEALSELGYTVKQAAHAKEALSILEATPELDLLFTDVVMPDMNGAELAEEVARTWPEVKILFMTGYTRNAIVHNGTLDQGVELLPKPFTIDQLANKVRRVLDKN